MVFFKGNCYNKTIVQSNNAVQFKWSGQETRGKVTVSPFNLIHFK